MYEIIFDENTIEFLKKLPKNIRERIFNKIIKAKNDPFHFFGRLSENNCYKLRVGDYRVISDIDDKKINVVLIGHRKNVYDKI